MSALGNRRRATRGAAALGLVLVATSILALIGGSVGPARADSEIPAGYTVRASAGTQTDVERSGPLIGLGNGTEVTLTVTAAEGLDIFGTEARLCQPGAAIAFNAEFVPDGGLCIDEPFNTDSDSLQVDNAAPENTVSEIVFRVGTGTRTWTAPDASEDTTPTLTCGIGHPCALWMKLAVPAAIEGGILFVHYDLEFSSEAATTSSTSTAPTSSTSTTAPGTPTTTSTSTSTSTPSSTSTSSSTSSTAPGGSSTTSTTVPGPLSVSPSSLAPGDTLNVTTTGWKADSTITAVLTSDPVTLGTLTADGSGKGTKAFAVPATVPLGAHKLTLTGTDVSGAARTLTADVTLTAQSATTTTTRAGGLSRTGADSRHLAWNSLALLAAGTLLLVYAARRQRLAGR